MASSFPTNLDSFTTKQDNVDSVLAAHVNDLQAAVVAAQTKIGVNGSADSNSLDKKVADLSTAKQAQLNGTGFVKAAGTSISYDNSTYLTADSPLDASKLSGAIPSGVTGTTQSANDNSTKLATTAYADALKSAALIVTNKRNQKRVYSTTSLATLTPEIDTYDVFCLTAQAAALTIANHSTSTPANGEMILIRILDNGTARAISFGTNYVAKAGVALPTTTVLSKNMCMLFIWDSNLSKYNLLSVGQEA